MREKPRHICIIIAEKHKLELEKFNDDERVEYSVEKIELEDY